MLSVIYTFDLSILTRSGLLINDRPCHRLVAAFFVLREKYNSRFRPHVSDHARVSRCLNSRLLYFVAVIYFIRFSHFLSAPKSFCIFLPGVSQMYPETIYNTKRIPDLSVDC